MSTRGTSTRVLFVAYGGGHAPMLTGLYHRMMASGQFDVTFLGLTTARLVLEKAGIPFIGFKDLILPEDSRALEMGEKLLQKLPPNLIKTPDEEAIAYLGLSYCDLVQQVGESAAHDAFEKKGRQAFLPLRPIERLFRKLSPELVVTTNSPRAEKASILTARKLGVPSICLVDLFGLPEVEYVGNPGYADRLCVLSDHTRQVFIEAGRHPDEIVVTGNPAFDRWADPILATRAEALRKKNGWTDKKVLLWASQPEPAPNGSLPRQVDRELFGIMARHPEWHCVIRPHPSESVHYDSLPSNISLSGGDDDLSSLLAASDMVITFNSTLGLEGVLLGKPLVTVDTSVQCQYLPYSKMGLSVGVNGIGDLEKGICRAFLHRPQGLVGLPAPGLATERVFQVVLDLLGVGSRL